MSERTALAVLLLGALVTLGFMLHAGSPDRPLWWIGFLPFGAWGVLPFGLLAFSILARRGWMGGWLRGSARGGPAASLLLVAAILLTGVSTFLLYQAFIAEPDAQSGIVFVFLPIWQIVAMLPFILGAQSLRRRAARMAADADSRAGS